MEKGIIQAQSLILGESAARNEVLGSGQLGATGTPGAVCASRLTSALVSKQGAVCAGFARTQLHQRHEKRDPIRPATDELY